MRASYCAKPEPAPSPLRALRDSWVLSLQARNLSPKTIRSYRDAANDLLRHLQATGGPVAGGDQYLPWIHVEDEVNPKHSTYANGLIPIPDMQARIDSWCAEHDVLRLRPHADDGDVQQDLAGAL